MKKLSTNMLFAILCLIASSVSAQDYTWMKGTNTVDQPGIYGSLGVPAMTNNPGSRNGACTWKDAAGNFWLFGGFGYDAGGTYDFLNDLWKYDPSSNMWTWISGDSVALQPGVYGTPGVSSPTNKPGSRGGSAAWVDASGNFWLFGGSGLDVSTTVTSLNDLWKYNSVTNEWTWMNGNNTGNQPANYGTLGVQAPSNMPGSSYLGAYWKDLAGDLWIFGGNGIDSNPNSSGALNDLWKYSISSNQWTWMKGDGLIDVNGTYGSLGVASQANTPGGRFVGASWVDNSGNFYLFGGLGFGSVSTMTDFLNDLWKYSPLTNEWTWIHGSNIAFQPGVYGTQGVLAPGNIPGARMAPIAWSDSNGDAYLFGGTGAFSAMSFDDMNDLWKYSSASNEWMWLKGSNTQTVNGTYGTMGTPAPANTPGSRYMVAGWIDSSDDLWLFGGTGIAANPQPHGDMNDLWKFDNCNVPQLTVTSSASVSCEGQTVTITAAGAATYSWNTLQTGPSITVSPVSTSTYIVTGTDISGCFSQQSLIQAVSPNPTANISVSSSTNGGLCSNNPGTVTVNGQGVATYSWNTGVVGQDLVITPTTSGLLTYTCYLINFNGCVSSSVVNVPVFQSPTLTLTTTKGTICTGQSATLQASGAVTYSWTTFPGAANSITVSPAQTSFYTCIGEDAVGCKSSASITQSVSTCTGIFETTSRYSDYLIYPNPNSGQFSIRGSFAGKNMKLQVTDLLGRIVLTQDLSSDEAIISTDLSKGVYYYQLLQNTKNEGTGKIIIE